MSAESVIKSNQEQAVASWVNYLNQVRLDRLVEFMKQQDINFEDAMANLDESLQNIEHLIETSRGGTKGIHGFIAETAEVGFENARARIVGDKAIAEWVNDNGPADLRRAGIEIQQKFYQSGLSLGAIAAHLDKYPDFIKNGGKYQIPKDQYDQIKYLLSISRADANKMPTSDGSFSLKQWEAVHEIFDNGKLDIDSIEPSLLDYKEVQVGKIEDTVNNERQNIKDVDEQRRDAARTESMPSLEEGLKATGISAVIEGTAAITFAIVQKHKEGKKLADYTAEDWDDVLKEGGAGTLKGGVRGASIYFLANYTATPASVASALVTASFGVAEQARLFRNGKLTEQQLIENSEMLCLDASISALSSLLGQALIPIPVVGAVIGNTVGATLYKIAKDSLNDKEQTIFKKYLTDIEKYRNSLEEQYKEFTEMAAKDVMIFCDLVEAIYSVDVMESFNSSVALASYVGIPMEEILDTKEKIDSFFLD